ncbi:MAG: hypothetical protein U0183_10645 [Polyangiaceae bacterium]
MDLRVLEARALRIDDASGIAVEGLSFATSGEKILVFGASAPVFRALAGELSVAGGELRVAGREPVAALRAALVGVAPRDPALPGELTPAAWVEWSARLANPGKSEAKARAKAALDAFALGPVAGTRLDKCVTTARRATVLAAALATGASTIVFEDPTYGLDDDVARGFAKVVAKALAPVRWALFAARIPLESPLALEADDALVLGRSELLARGAPADLAARERRFSVVVEGDVAAFSAALVRRGFSSLGAPPRLLVDLGSSEDVGTGDLFALALESGVTILELSPVAGALA